MRPPGREEGEEGEGKGGGVWKDEKEGRGRGRGGVRKGRQFISNSRSSAPGGKYW